MSKLEVLMTPQRIEEANILQPVLRRIAAEAPPKTEVWLKALESIGFKHARSGQLRTTVTNRWWAFKFPNFDTEYDPNDTAWSWSPLWREYLVYKYIGEAHPMFPVTMFFHDSPVPVLLQERAYVNKFKLQQIREFATSIPAIEGEFCIWDTARSLKNWGQSAWDGRAVLIDWEMVGKSGEPCRLFNSKPESFADGFVDTYKE